MTVHELTAASSAVAALAVVGGYLGVRSANRNAVGIAREERASRRRDELDALKRATYAKYLNALTALALASAEQRTIASAPEIRGDARIIAIRRQTDALTTARDLLAELELLGPDTLSGLAGESLESATKCTGKNCPPFDKELAKLRIAMRRDLEGNEIPDPQELDRISPSSIAATVHSGLEREHPIPSLPVAGETEVTDIPGSST
jgi:hypothetical protein